jgi:ADP-ribosyl-[dinitrogen reductase] hydrolase
VSVRKSAAAATPPGTYWVEPERFLAGAYPGHVDPAYAAARIQALIALGIDRFIDLTEPDELPPYEALLPAVTGRDGHPVRYSRHPIADHGLPRDVAQMRRILDELDKALATGRRVYLHCRAGIGRTGTVAGCFLARRLGSGPEALEALARLWRLGGRDRDWPRTPETEPQFAYVRDWLQAAAGSRRREPATEAPAVAVAGDVTDHLRDRYRGLVLGLVLGDALAAPAQHQRPGRFTPLADLLGGGPHELPRGAWSDDAALALLLAESLIERAGFDARDFLARLVRWQREGYRSATGQCVGISAATARAIAQAQWSGKPFAGSHDPAKVDKEPLPRAAIAAAFALSDPTAAIALAAEVARPTHQAPLVLDACRYVAALAVGALQGVAREQLLAPHFAPVPGFWQRQPLRREVAEVAGGSWRRPGFVPVADGSAVDALALALWALARGTQYRDTVLAAVNLGLDADVNGALVGALAGALYGAAALPPHWTASLAHGRQLSGGADDLLAAALSRIAVE